MDSSRLSIYSRVGSGLFLLYCGFYGHFVGSLVLFYFTSLSFLVVYVHFFGLFQSRGASRGVMST